MRKGFLQRRGFSKRRKITMFTPTRRKVKQYKFRNWTGRRFYAY